MNIKAKIYSEYIKDSNKLIAHHFVTFNTFKMILFIFLFFNSIYLFLFNNGFISGNIFDNSKQLFHSNYNPKINIIYFDKYDVHQYNKIKQKLIETQCSDMWANQREFINGIIRKFKPHKILEIGVNRGGSSIIILNSIDDMKGSKLYSIDLNTEKYIGECVEKYFPSLLKNWAIFKGNIATEFIEKIGKNIDMALIDTAHLEPGEILDFLIILPFLKEGAI